MQRSLSGRAALGAAWLAFGIGPLVPDGACDVKGAVPAPTLTLTASSHHRPPDVIVGSYPRQDEFEWLKRQRVTAIVCLLDPALPAEKVFLEQERRLAKQFGIEVVNFPMSVEKDAAAKKRSRQNSLSAADWVAHRSDTVYVHCYRGIDRAGELTRMLQERGIPARRRVPSPPVK